MLPLQCGISRASAQFPLYCGFCGECSYPTEVCWGQQAGMLLGKFHFSFSLLQQQELCVQIIGNSGVCGGINDNSRDNTYEVGSQSSHPHIQLIASWRIFYLYQRKMAEKWSGEGILSFDGRLLEVLCIFVYCDDVSLTWEQDAALSNYCCDRWTLGVLPTRIHLTEVKMSWQPTAKIVTWDLSNFEFNTQSRSTFF